MLNHSCIALREQSGDTEAEVDLPVADVVSGAIGRTQVVRAVAPRPPAKHAPATVTTFPCRTIGKCTFVALIPAVLRPFPDVATHVVQAHAFGFFCVTGLVFAPLFDIYQAILPTLPPPQYSSFPPVRQTYSHSASLGSRYSWPVFMLSYLMKLMMSCQLTFSTGQSSPHWLKWLGFLPITAFHCPWVTSVLPISKAYLMLKRECSSPC